MKNGLISVVIPLYNKGKHILDTISCVLNQSYCNYEIIVVDDGSTDNGPLLVRGLTDNRIRILSQDNRGAAAARNRGVFEAKGKYVAFLDADDQWDKDYLKFVVQLISRYPQACIFGTNYRIIENGNSRILEYPQISPGMSLIENYFISGKVYTPLWTSAVTVDRERFLQLGGFPEKCKICEDIDLWCKFAAVGKIAYLNQPLATYIRDASNMLSKSKDTTCYFPFLDNYREYIKKDEKRISDILEYIDYKKLVAVSYSLFIALNKYQARTILAKVPRRHRNMKKIVWYWLLSFAPKSVLKNYHIIRSKFKGV